MHERDVEFWTSAIDRVFAVGGATAGESLDEVRGSLLADVQRRTERADGGDVVWLASALGQSEMRLGIAVFFERLGWMPGALFESMIEAAVAQAAVDERSARFFVGACRTTVGLRRINDALLERLERGTASDRIGAARALRFALPNERGLDALGDVGARRRRVMLERFIDTDDGTLRRALIDQLELERSTDELGELEAEARRIAQTVKR